MDGALSILLSVLLDTSDYNQISRTENQRGHYRAAEAYARSALESATKAHLADDVIAIQQVILANALRQQSKFEEAERLLLDAIPKVEAANADPALLGTAQNNLGAIYFWRGDYAKAIPLLQRGMQTRISALGQDHPDVANSLLDLGAAEFKMGDLQNAFEHVSQSASIRRNKLGARDHRTLASEAVLAAILDEQGKIEDASALLSKVVDNARETLGPDHPDLAHYEEQYALLLSDHGDLVTARALQKDVVRIRRKTFGETSREYASSLRSAGEIELAAHNVIGAGSLLKRSAAAFRKVAIPGDPEYADTLDQLATWYVTCGDLPSAEKFFAAAGNERSQSSPTVSSAITFANLADIQARLKKPKDATENLLKAKAIIDALPESVRKTNPDCASILDRAKTVLSP